MTDYKSGHKDPCLCPRPLQSVSVPLLNLHWLQDSSPLNEWAAVTRAWSMPASALGSGNLLPGNRNSIPRPWQQPDPTEPNQSVSEGSNLRELKDRQRKEGLEGR